MQSATYSAAVASGLYGGHIGDGISTANTATLGETKISPRQSTTSISYDQASGTYTLTDTYGSGMVSSSNLTGSSGYFDRYQKQAADGSDSLVLYGNVRSANPVSSAPVQLSYSSFAEWTHADILPERTRRVYFTFGQQTGAGAMPRSGSAAYSTTLIASSLSGLYAPVSQQAITGTATFNANFASGSVSTNLQLSSSNFAYTGTGTISGDSFGGNFASLSPTFTSGSFQGGFYGPDAKEMGYTFHIMHSNPDPYVGASVAPGLTMLTGVVAGAKN